MKNSFLLLSRLRSVLLALTLMIGCSFAFAQTKTISGTVTGSGLPLPGVNVKIKGGSTGAVTDFDGIYKIDAKTGDVLEFSSLGFETQKVTVGEDSNIDVALAEDVESLDEVVVIGYGQVSKEKLVGSVSTIKSEDIEKVQAVSFEQALVANAPGVRVVTSEGGPGAGFKIQVRGNTSFLASADPLYVIDGFPVETGSVGNNQDLGGNVGDLGQSTTSPLANLDPSNIESLTVLKDASSTAIYGSRGANGVILITTKKGKAGKANISFDSSVGVSSIYRQLDLLNPQEYVDAVIESSPFNFQERNQFGERRFTSLLFVDRLGNRRPIGGEDGLRIIDLRDILFRDAIIQKHSLRITGGSDKTRYSGAFSYTDQEGIIRNSDFRRYSMNFNLSSKVNDKLTATMSFNGGLAKRNGVVTAANGNGTDPTRSGVLTTLVRASNVRPARESFENADQEVEFDELGFVTRIDERVIINPITFVEETARPSTQISANLNTALSYELIDRMTLKSTFGGSIWQNLSTALFPFNFGFGQFDNGRVSESNAITTSFSNENTLTYNFNVGSDHNFTSLLGMSIQRTQGRRTGFSSVGFGAFGPQAIDNVEIGAPDQNGAFRSNVGENGLVSYFGRFDYNYLSKYFIQLVGRFDSSSRFRKGFRTGFFPSIGLRWSAGKEKFIQDIDFISDLNFKASAGLSGNQRISNFTSQEIFQLRRTGDSQITSTRVQLPNDDLTWETTETIDGSVELGVLNNRLKLQAEVYQKTTKDLLYALLIDPSFGFVTNITGTPGVPAVATNIGSIRNSGLEFNLAAQVINNPNFKWDFNANITFNKNEVLDLGGRPSLVVDSPTAPRLGQDYILEAGEAAGSFYGLKNKGVYRFEDFVEFDGLSEAEQNELFVNSFGISANPEVERGDDPTNDFTLKPGIPRIDGQPSRPGLARYEDINGDGVINLEDRTVIGSSQPDHFGGFTNSFSHKNFDLSVQFNWSYGNEVYNQNRFPGSSSSFGTNGLGFLRNRFRTTNRNTDVPSLRGFFPVGEPNRPPAESSFIEDASFLRLSNIALGYRLPKSLVEKLEMSDLKIYGAVDNVYVWTNYSGYDPDVSIGNNPATPGLDFDAYPRARTFRVGIKGSF